MDQSDLICYSLCEESDIIEKDMVKRKYLDNNNEIIITISSILEKIIEENHKIENYEKIMEEQSTLSFFCIEKPNVTIKNYLKRINYHLYLEESTLIISIILIDRICNISKIILNEYNIHRIILSSIFISLKFNEDKNFSHKFYSLIVGVFMDELQDLEIQFLKLINYKIFVSDKIYYKYWYYLKENL